jgi:hypothetical protein
LIRHFFIFCKYKLLLYIANYQLFNMQLKLPILLTLLTQACLAQWTTHALPTKRTNMSGILANGKVWFAGESLALCVEVAVQPRE